MKKIAITLGDPGGIGPEVVLKAIVSEDVRRCCLPVVIGAEGILLEALKFLGLAVKLVRVGSPDELTGNPDVIEFIEAGKVKEFIKGKPSREGGKASCAFIKKAVELAMGKKVDALTTAPVSKESLKMAGLPWPGHTEMLAELTGAKDYAMSFVGGPIRVILVTIHVPLKDVPGLITKEKVFKTILLAEKALRMLGIERGRIGVSGLNPHAGEAGLFGDEEIKEIAPALLDAKKSGINVSGPYPPDVIFHKAYNGLLDMVVAMYHDQGLIPLKMVAFEKGVNITVGLPIIRTSPDHGTAYDIAWGSMTPDSMGSMTPGSVGKANPLSMIEAIKTAVKLRLID